jgi:hypothetical protein
MAFCLFLTFIVRLLHACCLAIVSVVAAQAPEGDRLSVKSFEAAIAFSQTLSQWCFVTIGATVLVLLQSSFHRPVKAYARRSYLCFVPAWACLVFSIYNGTKAQRVYLAYLLNTVTTLEGARLRMNSYMGWQIVWMEFGLAWFIPWLLVVLVWWLSDH